MTAELSPTEYVTPPLRLAFPAIFEPKPTMKGGDNLKYQAAVLIPPSVDLKPFYARIKAAMIDKFKEVIKLPARANPIKACAEKELDGYEDGWHYINTKSGYQPSVVDQARNEIIDKEKVYAGCWCRFHLVAFGWDHPTGGKGVFVLPERDSACEGRRPPRRPQVRRRRVRGHRGRGRPERVGSCRV